MYRQSAHGYATNCRVDFDDVTTPPQAAPDESVDGGSSSGGTIVWLGALLGAAVLVARWAYVRWRRSEARAAPDSPRTPGYERRPQFHFMLLCGLIALLAFALVFALSVFLQPRSAARTPIPGVTSVPPGLTEPQPPPRPTLPTGMPTIVEPTG